MCICKMCVIQPGNLKSILLSSAVKMCTYVVLYSLFSHRITPLFAKFHCVTPRMGWMGRFGIVVDLDG